MPFYRDETGQAVIHMLIRGGAPAPCQAPAMPGDNLKVGEKCGRRSVALCDFREQVLGVWRTCDAPMCEHHRKVVGHNEDHCPKHPATE